LAELGAVLGVAQSQASRLDTGARGFGADEVRRLGEWYGLGEGERQRLVALAEDARRRAWWQKVDLPDSYRTLIGFEQAAERISEFCNAVVPGILQTRRYAAAIESLYGGDEEKAAQRTDVRMRRQAVLDRVEPPEMFAIIDEAVLARAAGSPDVMREQLEYLLELSRRPRLTIQVIAFEAGMYPTPGPQFILLDMGARLPAVYYSEDQFGSRDASDDAAVGQGRLRWQAVQRVALDPVRSAELVESYWRTTSP
jgi:hypothetical protein